MFEQDYIEIMDCCTNLIAELKDYKFPSDDSSESGRKDKPEDKNNHLINPLEWIAMELPTNPADAVYGIYSNRGYNIIEQRKQDDKLYQQYALRDPDAAYGSVYEDVNFIEIIGGMY
jgi:hypothetical protein